MAVAEGQGQQLVGRLPIVGRCALTRRRVWRAAQALAAVAVGSLLLAACSSSTSPSKAGAPPSVTGKPVNGGVASYAMPIGEDFSWMLPLENQANYEDYDSNVESGMWRPLYFAGGPGTTGINYKLSIGEPPVYSNGDTEVTITLHKGWMWSDGVPVTTSDVRFFFELEAAGAKLGKYAPYVPGEMPDDIASVTYNGPYQFTIHLTRAFNPAWFTGNQLTWIYPLPRQAWDKTCSSCAVGHDASTLAGAKAVYNFLYKQSEDLSTYATNPLWKVVDGPWVIKSYDPTTYETELVANPAYTGPDKPHLAGYRIYSFSSDTAELDAVRSGTVDFGFIPFTDTAEIPYFESHGYNVEPWRVFYNEDMEFGYTGPWKALVSQLYIRQALQHLVNEKLYLTQTLHGYGLLDYGIAPDFPGSDLVSPELKHDPYPYDPAAAAKLLSEHGWVKSSSGIDVCERPGTAANECGAGIPKGKTLSILFMYSTGTPSFLAQVEAFQSAAKQVGVQISLDGQTEDTMYSIAGVCPPGPCDWGMAGYSEFMWDFGQYEVIPGGGNQFGQGNYWAGGYSSAQADSLIKAVHQSAGLSALYAEENYISKQVASLWWPVSDYEIVVAPKDLGGWYPLNPYANYQPSTWYFTSK
ncbi:ABC transporter substrate-binding protein [Aciditerrimonas ferrireducens]|jgi:peptide/nickel transport system substrate-binding protein|uniref:ABC transporter substrate-binding protein n=1 Tax=Aciditerrimonas ferrireducens TaxID=667306 RepID=A0ABV6BYZ8_9ACTN|nr:ABC transporter substrate-binding protein [Aciditerrimonas ferrireducens]MCK4176880.1 ABC transporter substrate-binding protein [Aciditerrimonas ferrireducens]